MNQTYFNKNIFIADDDSDDLILFEDALREICKDSQLTTAKDGHQLMQILDAKVPPPPDVIFLDLNMPRKNGFECLKEIRETPKLINIPVVIFSTSSNENIIDTTFSLGANCYICKPNTHQLLKQVIEKVLALNLWENNLRLPKEKFVLAVS